MHRASITFLLAIIALVGCDEKQPPPPVVPTVTTTPVVAQDVTIYRSWVGLLDGYQNADIRAQVTGYLVSQEYKEGSLVKKGDVLFKIDERPFQATLAAAEANYAQAVAQAQLAEITEKRQKDLYEKQAISSQDYDVAKQNLQAAVALAAAAQAQVQAAQLNLDYSTIRAPFDGIVGTALVQVGALVGPAGSAAVLTQISQVDPIKAIFSITESQYLLVAQHLETLREGTSEPRIVITLPNGEDYPVKGHFHFVNRQVDSSTGTINVETVFANPDRILRPGLFVRVTIPVRIEKDALLVPQQSLVEEQGSYHISIVLDDNTIQSILVQKGEQQGLNIVVTSEHLKPSMRVVVNGAEKVRPKMKVEIKTDNRQ